MRKETFQKALRATARITCCASIFGLGCDFDSKTETNTDTGSDNQDTNDEDTTDTDTTDTDTTDTNDTEDSGTQPDPVYDEECEVLISEAFPDPTQWPDPETIAQEVKDCCQLAAEYYDSIALQADDSIDWDILYSWEYRDQCCEALEWQSDTLACTPWGPPMPPKFRNAKIHRPKHLRKIMVRHA